MIQDIEKRLHRFNLSHDDNHFKHIPLSISKEEKFPISEEKKWNHPTGHSHSSIACAFVLFGKTARFLFVPLCVVDSVTLRHGCQIKKTCYIIYVIYNIICTYIQIHLLCKGCWPLYDNGFWVITNIKWHICPCPREWLA